TFANFITNSVRINICFFNKKLNIFSGFPHRNPEFFMPFSISFQYIYVPIPLIIQGFFTKSFNNTSILIQYFIFILSPFYPLSLFVLFLSLLAKFYSNSEKTMKKQP